MLQIKCPLIINDDCAFIPVAPDSFAIIDYEDLERIKPYHWFVIRRHGVKYAARSVGSGLRRYFVKMHRQVMRTPNNNITHHWNRYGLDNRKGNLENCTESRHKWIHKYAIRREK